MCCLGQLFTTTTPTPPWQGGELNHHSPPLLRRGPGGGGCRCQPSLMVNSLAGRHSRSNSRSFNLMETEHRAKFAPKVPLPSLDLGPGQFVKESGVQDFHRSAENT